MSVEGYTGLWASGKTLMLAVEARRALDAQRRVAATFHVEGAEYIDPAGGLDALFAFRPEKGTRDVAHSVLILIDEIGITFPSRLWAKAPGSMLYYWSQAGKMGIEVRWSAQSEKRVDTVVREVTHYVHRCKCITLRGRPRFVRTSTFYPGESEGASTKAQAGKRLRSKFNRITPAVLASYDTLEGVALSAHLTDTAPARGTRAPALSGPGGARIVRPGSRPSSLVVVSHSPAPGQGGGISRRVGRVSGSAGGPNDRNTGAGDIPAEREN